MNAADPAAVLRTFDVALNAHDPDAALALFAEGAVVRYEPAPPPPARAVYNGREEIRGLIEALIAQGVAVQVGEYRAEGERASSRGRAVYAAGHERLGGNPVILEGEAVVRGGKIVSLTFTFSPESLARIRAAATTRSQGTPQRRRERGGT